MRRLVLALAMVGCASCASAQTLPETVRIGVLVDMSSTQSAADGAGTVMAAKMAVEDFGGKVRGRPIEILSGDHTMKPDLASAISRKWLDDGVTALVGGGASSTALAMQFIANQHDRPLLVTSAATTAFTNESCSENTVQFTYDSFALAKSIIPVNVPPEKNSWFFITVNYLGGTMIEDIVAKMVREAGGKILGSSRHPSGATDYASQLLQAKSSGAKFIGMATYQADLVNALKQAVEFNVGRDGSQSFRVPLIFMTDVKGVGLKQMPQIETGAAFYWDLTDKTRDFAKRFAARMNGQFPETLHAGAYSAVLHYLKALDATGDIGGKVVVAKMKELPVQDFWNDNTKIRIDGRVMHPFHLLKLKTPETSKSPYDLFTVTQTVAPENAWQPLSESKCRLVTK